MGTYRVLAGEYSEGWKPGDIIDLDEDSALPNVAKGHMEACERPKEKAPKPSKKK